jgi:Zn-dependent protease
MRSPQYYNQPPRPTANWLENFRPLVEPPLAYIVFFAGIALAIYLSTRDSFRVAQYGPRILILLIAFPIHELAHALVADYLGDSTPRYYGRITLNPLAQLNLIGSFLMLFIGLGWAYVPISPSALRPNPRAGHMIVAAAGPISNVLLAIVIAIGWYWVTITPGLERYSIPAFNNPVFRVLFQFTWINLALFFLNLVPIAPLDGFFVLKGLLPYELAYQLEGLQRYGMLIFLAVFFIAPFLGLPILEWLIFGPAASVAQLLFVGV